MTAELARRAVACKGWRWMPGMLTNTAYRVCDDGYTWPHLQRGDTLRSGLHFPDLTDPATVGCLLALVREAWGCHVHLRHRARGRPRFGKVSVWEPVDGLARRLVAGPRVLCATEAAALVAALEAAP